MSIGNGLNLLPWREQERERHKKQFFAMVGGSVLLGVGVIALASMYFDGQKSAQDERNDFLQSNIDTLKRETAEIQSLKENRIKLLGRMKSIEKLQGTRPAIVHLMDEVASTLPQGMYLERLNQFGTQVILTGKTIANPRVSSYMQSLNESPWLKSSDLEVIAKGDLNSDGRYYNPNQNKKDEQLNLRSFRLKVQQLLHKEDINNNETLTDQSNLGVGS